MHRVKWGSEEGGWHQGWSGWISNNLYCVDVVTGQSAIKYLDCPLPCAVFAVHWPVQQVWASLSMGPHTIGLRLPGHWGKLTIYDVGAQVQVTPDPWSGLMNPSFPLMLRSFKLVKVSLIIISGSLWVSDFWDFVIEHWFLEKEQCFQCACACRCVG